MWRNDMKCKYTFYVPPEKLITLRDNIRNYLAGDVFGFLISLSKWPTVIILQWHHTITASEITDKSTLCSTACCHQHPPATTGFRLQMTRNKCSCHMIDFGIDLALTRYQSINVNTLRPRRNEQHFADDIFKRIFFNENVWISIKISLKFVPKGQINNIPALLQIMAWPRSGDKPLSEPMMVSLPTHTCVTRPQWVKAWDALLTCAPRRSIVIEFFWSVRKCI